MKHPYHRISTLLFPMRCGGYWVMSVSALILYMYGLMSAWVGIYAVFTACIWAPAIFYISNQMAYAKAKRFEFAVLEYADPVLTGIWLILAKGSLWYMLFALLGLGAGICAVLGFFAWLRGLFIIGILGVLSLAFNDFKIVFNTPLILKLFALTSCTIYTVLIGLAQYRVKKRIEDAKIALESSVKELSQINQFMQATISARSLSSLIQHINFLMKDFFDFKSVDLCLFDENQKKLTLYRSEKTQVTDRFFWKIDNKCVNESFIVNVFSGVDCKVINNVKNSDILQNEDKIYLDRHRHESLLMIPLIHADKHVGGLCLFSDSPIEENTSFLKRIMNYFNNVPLVIRNYHIVKAYIKNQYELNNKNILLYDESKKLSKYLSPQIYDWIFSEKTSLQIGSKRKRITYMIVSMQNFYQILDGLPSEESTRFVNSYLTCMSALILKYGGTIDQYLGVQIRIFFGDPNSLGVKQDALNCLQLAVHMCKDFLYFKETWPQSLVGNAKLRIAISSGYTDVGNFGSQHRINYTVVGNIVSLVNYLLLNDRTEQIIITEETMALTKEHIDATLLEILNYGYKSKKIPIYQLNNVEFLEIEGVK